MESVMAVNRKYDPLQDMLKSTHDMDAMRQAIEELAGYHREWNGSPVFTIEEVQQARKAAKAQIEKLQQEMKKFDQILEFIEQLPFKEGDAAFHKDHGNVLIGGVALNEVVENSTYSIVLRTGKRLQVKTDELMPISEATKVLFGKK